jgi:hypothetical protein|nr:MAG TPA: hypothetical protein [Caudoviricetes sp.]
MNNSDLTNETYDFLVLLYCEYLQRIKDGCDIENAALFNNDPIGLVDYVISSEPDSGTYIDELQEHEYINSFIAGDFELNRSAIKLMETRFSRSLDKVLNFINALK